MNQLSWKFIILVRETNLILYIIIYNLKANKWLCATLKWQSLETHILYRISLRTSSDYRLELLVNARITRIKTQINRPRSDPHVAFKTTI